MVYDSLYMAMLTSTGAVDPSLRSAYVRLQLVHVKSGWTESGKDPC